MVVHAHPSHLAKRQDPLAPPTNVAGITNVAVTEDSSSVTATSLAFDVSATPGTGTAPLLGVTFTPVVTYQSNSTSTPSATPGSVTTSSDTSKPIAMSTVVGTCVGAFIGAAALIILGFWFYRRYSRSLKQRAMSRGSRIQGRNLHGDVERRRSRLEPWNKLDGDDDRWENMYQTKEVDQVAPMEKLTMFKKTPSVRTAFTHNPDDPPLDFPQSFAPFDPDLARSLSTEKASMPEPRPFLGRVDASPVSSWDSDTAAKDSYLSVRSRMSGGAVSPTLNMAIPTPMAVLSEPHKWESAEVVHYSGGQSAEVLNPFDPEHDEDNRKSAHNPFFGAQDYTQPRSRSNSVTKSPTSKGKERMRYSTDPFEDANLPLPPKPLTINHEASNSTSSIESRHKALQSLMAALEISEAEVNDRLRVTSMQPSVMSQASQYTADGNEDDMTSAFPLPPSSAESSPRL